MTKQRQEYLDDLTAIESSFDAIISDINAFKQKVKTTDADLGDDEYRMLQKLTRLESNVRNQFKIVDSLFFITINNKALD